MPQGASGGNPTRKEATAAREDRRAPRLTIRVITSSIWPTSTGRDWKDGSAKACANMPVNGLLGACARQCLQRVREETSKAGTKRFVWTTPSKQERSGMLRRGRVRSCVRPTLRGPMTAGPDATLSYEKRAVPWTSHFDARRSGCLTNPMRLSRERELCRRGRSGSRRRENGRPEFSGSARGAREPRE
jgi:hypothetical protein